MATLDYFKSAILFKAQTLSDTPMPQVITQLNKYMGSHSATASVEEEAILFYLLNQSYGLLSMNVDSKATLTENEEKLTRLYLQIASESSTRLFYYMLLIITREARHLHSSDTLYAKLEASYGVDMLNFIKKIRSQGEDSAVNSLKTGQTTLETITLGQYVNCIVDVFNKGTWGGGYGGKPWGNIANTLLKFVNGDTSIEIMNDTAWTLAHNNGPMFNKGMLYKNYTPYLFKILDVQRAGMIPQLICEGIGANNTLKIKEAYALVKQIFPQEVEGYVDWFKVEALGSLKKYPNEKKLQQQNYGGSVHNPNIGDTSKFYVNEVEYATILQKRAA